MLLRMKFTSNLMLTLIFNHSRICLLISIFLVGITFPAFGQGREFSKQDLRTMAIDSIFDQTESRGLDTKSKLRYDLYFSDLTKEQLTDLLAKLEKDTFEMVFIRPEGDKNWLLRVKKNEVHSRESMIEWDKRIRKMTYSFLVDDYLGFSISPADINAFAVPKEKFVSFLRSLDNETLFNVASNLISGNANDRAILAFGECIERRYKVDTSNFQRGNAYVATNDLVQGIEHWEQARNFNPAYTEAFMKLGIIFFENSHFNRSLYNFQKAEVLKPEDDEILYYVSKCLLQLKRYHESYEYAIRARELNPKNEFVKGVIDILNQPHIRKLRKQPPEKIE